MYMGQSAIIRQSYFHVDGSELESRTYNTFDMFNK